MTQSLDPAAAESIKLYSAVVLRVTTKKSCCIKPRHEKIYKAGHK